MLESKIIRHSFNLPRFDSTRSKSLTPKSVIRYQPGIVTARKYNPRVLNFNRVENTGRLLKYNRNDGGIPSHREIHAADNTWQATLSPSPLNIA